MKTWTLQLKKILKILCTISVLYGLNFLAVEEASALDLTSNYVYGFSIGLGGSGIDQTVIKDDGSKIDASSSESPGMMGISIEKFINNKWSLAISHRRGFKFGPFSHGVGFTGVIARRYFLRPATFLPNPKLENSVTLQSWVPFAGFGGGVASGSITREKADAIPDVDSSGIFMGVHLGVDYHLYTNMILRPEFFTSATFMNNSKTPAVVKEYGLIVGFHFKL